MLCFGFSLVMVVYAAGAWKREWWQYGLQLVRLELHGVRESPIHANFDSFMWRIHDHMQFFWDISGQPSRHWFLLKEMKKQACSMCLKQCVRLHGAGDEAKSALRSLSPSFLNRQHWDAGTVIESCLLRSPGLPSELGVCEASARGLTLLRTAMELRRNSSLNNVLVMPAASSAETAFSSQQSQLWLLGTVLARHWSVQ